MIYQLHSKKLIKEKSKTLNFQLLKNVIPVKEMDLNLDIHLIDAHIVVEVEK